MAYGEIEASKLSYLYGNRTDPEIRFGIPKGSLNREEENRGCTALVLKKADFEVIGYDPRREIDFPQTNKKDSFIKFVCAKPKTLIGLLERGVIDMAILGADMVAEKDAKSWLFTREIQQRTNNVKHSEADATKLPDLPYGSRGWLHPIEWIGLKLAEGYNPKRLPEPLSERLNEWDKNNLAGIRNPDKYLSYHTPDEDFGLAEIRYAINLGYGKIDIHWGTKDYDKLIDRKISEHLQRKEMSPLKLNICSAYPNLAIKELDKFISMNEPQGEEDYELLDSSDNSLVIINKISSGTEAMIELGLADFVVDCTASGLSFENHKLLKTGKPIFRNSTAGLYFSKYFSDKYRTAEQDALRGYEPYFIGKTDEIMHRLEIASIEYSATRPDSIYYRHGGSQAQ